MATGTNGSTDEFVHRALLYRDDADYLAATVPFLSAGVRDGDALLVVCDPAKRALLHSRLGAAAGTVEFADAEDWYRTPGKALGGYHDFVGDHAGDHGLVRIVGEPVWTGLSPVEIREWKRYESISNVAFAGSRVWGMCSYNESTLPADILAAARSTHPELADGPGSVPSPGYVDPDTYYGTCNGAADEELAPVPSATVTMPFDTDIAELRDFAARHARALGLPDDRIPDFVLAVNELTTNAVQHGAGARRIQLWRTDHMVLCEVTDAGSMTSSEVKAEFLGYLPPEPLAGTGRGLWIARQLCDLLEIRLRPPGTTVRIHMLLPH